MKSLLKLGAFAAVTFFAVSVQASALYWQVTADTGATFEYAQLMVTGGSLGTGSEVLDVVEAEGPESGPNYVSLTNTDLEQYGVDGYSFFVEMVNYSDQDGYTTVATGATYSYNELVSSGYVATGATSTAAAQAAASQANMGSAVPEPSSGLLLLVGGAMLALRRRRQK